MFIPFPIPVCKRTFTQHMQNCLVMVIPVNSMILITFVIKTASSMGNKLSNVFINQSIKINLLGKVQIQTTLNVFLFCKEETKFQSISYHCQHSHRWMSCSKSLWGVLG
jgi:hypothetical protein